MADKKQLPKAVHFEVVGARGVLGEEERSHKMAVTTAFLAGNPLFAPLLDPHTIALHMYSDAGIKNAEHLLKEENQDDPAQLKAQLQQATQILQKVGAELQQEKQKSAVKMEKIKADDAARQAQVRTTHLHSSEPCLACSRNVAMYAQTSALQSTPASADLNRAS